MSCISVILLWGPERMQNLYNHIWLCKTYKVKMWNIDCLANYYMLAYDLLLQPIDI